MTEAVKKKNVAYLMWLQQRSSEAMDEYHRAMMESKREVRMDGAGQVYAE